MHWNNANIMVNKMSKLHCKDLQKLHRNHCLYCMYNILYTQLKSAITTLTCMFLFYAGINVKTRLNKCTIKSALKKCKYDDEWDVKFTLLRYSKIVKKSLPILHVWPCIQKAKKCNHNSNLNVSFFNMGLNKISNLCLKYLQRLHWIHC